MDHVERAVLKRPAGFLVPVVFAAIAGYLAWRVAAHRLHLFGAPAVWIGFFVFAAGVFFLRAFWQGGPRAGAKAAALIAALIVCAAVLIGLGLAIDRTWDLLARNPGKDAAWMIAIAGLFAMSARAASFLRK